MSLPHLSGDPGNKCIVEALSHFSGAPGKLALRQVFGEWVHLASPHMMVLVFHHGGIT